jgi:hypothetical protein
MTPSSKQDETQPSKRTLSGVIRNTLIIYGLFIIIPLVIGVIIAVNSGENAAQGVMYLRDLLWVIILLLTIPVLIGTGVLLVQIAILFGVIRVDIGSLFSEIRGAFQAISGTARFIGETVARPIIRVWTFFSGGWAFMRELTRLFAAIRRRPETESTPESDETMPSE